MADDGSRESDDEERGVVPAEDASTQDEPQAESPAEEPAEPVVADELPPEPGAAEEYHRRARLAEDRLAEVLSAYRTLKADNESYRQRTTRTIERQFQQRHDTILLKFIDVLDNLDRALEASQTSAVSPQLVQGLILVRTQVLQILQDEGLERIPVLGLPYDPHVSESMGIEPVTDADHHHVVVKELLRGYKLNGRVARASRVVLGEYAEAAADAIEKPPPPAAEGAPPAEDEPSLEEIIARVESQEALFAAFNEGADESPEPTPVRSESGDEEPRSKEDDDTRK